MAFVKITPERRIAIVADLRAHYLETPVAIFADRYGLSKQTIYRICKAEGLTGQKSRWDVTPHKPKGPNPMKAAKKAPAKSESEPEEAEILQRGPAYLRAQVPANVRKALKAKGIDALTYSDAFDELEALNLSTFVRPWQLLPRVRHYEGYCIDADGAVHRGEPMDTWKAAADRALAIAWAQIGQGRAAQ